jgi:PAS domain S-box-containing protein/putative nucleotidyltransferase with HDIG domain
LVAFAVYGLAFLPLSGLFGSSAAALAAIPVLVAGWLLGTSGGLLAGVLSIPLNTVLLNLAGYPGWDVIIRQGGGPGTLALMLIGLGVGRLHDLGERLKLELARRQRTETHLQENEARLRATLASAPIVLWTLDRDGVFTLSEGRGLAGLGREPGQAVGQSVFDLYRDVPQIVENSRRALAGETFTSRVEVRGATFESYHSPVRTSDGDIVGAIGVATDITEYRRVEAALQESEARYRSLFEDSPISLWEEDFSAVKQRLEALRRKGVTDFRIYLHSHPDVAAECARLVKITNVNQATLKLFRATSKAELFHNLDRVFGPESYDAFAEELVTIAEGLTEFQRTGINRTLAGDRLDVSLSWSAVPGYEGSLSRVIISLVDITERRRAEAERERQAAELTVLYRASGHLFDVADPQRLARQVAQAVTREFAFVDCGVMLVDESGTELKRVARAGDYQVTATSALLLSGSGLTVAAARNGQMIYAPDVQADPRYLANDSRTRSELALPLRAGNRTLGVLDLQSPEPDAFDERARRILRVFAERAGLALENARLFQEIRQRATELNVLVKISSAMRAAQTRAEMLPVLLDQLLGLLKADGVALGLRSPTNGDTMFEIGRGALSNSTGLRIPAGQGISGHVIATGQIYLNNDIRTDPHIYRPDLLGDIRALVCVPLITQEQTSGVLLVGRKTDISQPEVSLLTAVADLAANALRRASLHEQTEQHLQRLAALHTIDAAINASLDSRVTLEVLLDQVISQLRVDACAILLLNPLTQTLEYAAGRGFRNPTIQRTPQRLGEGETGRAALERRIIVIPDLRESPQARARTGLLITEGFISYYAVPLIAKGQVTGVLEIFRRTLVTADPEWLDFLKTLAEQAAIAVENALLFDDLQRSNQDLSQAYDATIEGWSRALDLRDKETEGHTVRVTEITERLARSMGVSDAQLIHIRRGALLHDIGKMGIPDSILLKPGPLNDDEWITMRRHPQYAYEMLAPIAYLRSALDIPYCHHEKWDGSGYPRGLKGEQIPLAARLFALVDVWDALRSDRPYRPAWAEERVREYIREQAGKHFDPQVVAAFRALGMSGE